jgi:hypothetical protein
LKKASSNVKFMDKDGEEITKNMASRTSAKVFNTIMIINQRVLSDFSIFLRWKNEKSLYI